MIHRRIGHTKLPAIRAGDPHMPPYAVGAGPEISGNGNRKANGFTPWTTGSVEG
jgi:hypothetical protein